MRDLNAHVRVKEGKEVSSVCTCWRVVSILDRAVDCSFRQCAQKGCGVYPTSHSMDNADLHLNFSAQLRIYGAVPPLKYMFMMWNLVHQ